MTDKAYYDRMADLEAERAARGAEVLRQSWEALRAANENDYAPTIDLPSQKSPVGIFGVLGSVLEQASGGRPALAALQQRQDAVERYNATIEAQEQMENQRQEGYLKRRQQQRDEEAAQLQFKGEMAALDAKTRQSELGAAGEASERAAAAQAREAAAERARQDREFALKLGSDWVGAYGRDVEILMAMLRKNVELDPNGNPLQDADGNPVALSPGEAQATQDRIRAKLLLLPEDHPVRAHYEQQLTALREAAEEAARVEDDPIGQAARFSTPGPVGDGEGPGFRSFASMFSQDTGVSADDQVVADYLGVDAMALVGSGYEVAEAPEDEGMTAGQVLGRMADGGFFGALGLLFGGRQVALEDVAPKKRGETDEEHLQRTLGAGSELTIGDIQRYADRLNAIDLEVR